MSAGWFDFRRIRPRSALHHRSGVAPYFVKPDRAILYGARYAVYRPEEDRAASEAVADMDLIDSFQLANNTVKQSVKYAVFRPDSSPDDLLSEQKGRKKSSVKRPVRDRGLGNSPNQIAARSLQLQGKFNFAEQVIFSPDPTLMELLVNHGLDPFAATEAMNETFIPALFESLGLDAEVEIDFSFVTHTKRDRFGRAHPHCHSFIAGTGRDTLTASRVELPFITAGKLSRGHQIAERVVEEELDRRLGRTWRLEVPEYAHTFYDPVVNPRPQPDPELDALFPDLAAELAEPAEGFGEPDELKALIEDWFPASFWDATPVKSSDEADHATAPLIAFLRPAPNEASLSEPENAPTPMVAEPPVAARSESAEADDLPDDIPVLVTDDALADSAFDDLLAAMSKYPDWLMPFEVEAERWFVSPDESAVFALVEAQDSEDDRWSIALVTRWRDAQTGRVERAAQPISWFLPTDDFLFDGQDTPERATTRARQACQIQFARDSRLLTDDLPSGLEELYVQWLTTNMLETAFDRQNFLPDLPRAQLPFDEAQVIAERAIPFPPIHWVGEETYELDYGVAVRPHPAGCAFVVVKRWQVEDGSFDYTSDSFAIDRRTAQAQIGLLTHFQYLARPDPDAALRAVQAAWAENTGRDQREFLSDGPANPFDTHRSPFVAPPEAPHRAQTTDARDAPPPEPDSGGSWDWEL